MAVAGSPEIEVDVGEQESAERLVKSEFFPEFPDASPYQAWIRIDAAVGRIGSVQLLAVHRGKRNVGAISLFREASAAVLIPVHGVQHIPA